MASRSRVFTIVAATAFAAAALTGRGAAGAHAQSALFDPDAALVTFHDSVVSYAELHRRLAPLPAAGSATDSLSRLLTSRYLASAIRAARREARQGDVFTPRVATVFRQMLADSIGERDGETFLTGLGSGAIAARGLHPTVNESYSMAQVYRVPSDVRLGLPPLPAELDYRVAAHDLLLWDIYAGIVVDFVPDAFMSPVYTEE
jgi:hypothetical protein